MNGIGAILLFACAGAQREGDPESAHLVSRWTLDGDAKDALGKTHGTTLGRTYFVDSPVGASGQMIVLNGIDASVEVRPAAELGAGKEDFSISLWICPLEMRDCTILSRPRTWTLIMKRNGSVRFQTAKGEALETAPNLLSAHRWFHLVIAIHRGEEGKGSGFWLNGEEAATGNVRAGDLDPAQAPLFIGRGDDAQSFTCGLIDDLRLYAKALDQNAIINLAGGGLPGIRNGQRHRPPFQGRFELGAIETVAFVGGENVLAMQDAGHLEAILCAGYPHAHVFSRCLAWEGDTVYEQPRPLNFGSWRDQLSRAGAGVVFVQFGGMEALEGKAGLERFAAAYEKLLGDFEEVTKKVVVLSPTPFERPPAPLTDLSNRNEDLRLYVESMKKVAAARSALFVDLFAPRWEGPLTRDGIHLTEAGHLAVAREIARQLGATVGEPSEELRHAIQRKNRIWLNYWRPSNWAFLNGDRIEQPSSRDHVDRRVRWFPVEVQETLARVRRAEGEIRKLLEAKR